MMSVLSSEYALALGIRHGEDGILTLPFETILTGRLGYIHGGAIGGFLCVASDVAMERNRRTPESQFRVLTTSLQFLRGARERDLHCATTIQLGGKVATVNAVAWQDDRERPVATSCRKYLLEG